MTNSYREIFSQSSKVLIIHLALFLFCSGLIYFTTFGNLIIEVSQFVHWDANWYISIKEGGYIFVENKQNNTGFFPLFPLLWKVTHLSIAGICILNLLLFILSFYLLVFFFEPKKKTQYLFLAAPSFLFFITPFSESLFFLFSTLILIGLKKDNWLLTAAAFMLAVFTRSAGTIFIPALIGSAYFLSNASTIKKTVTEYTLYIITCISATLLVIYFQFVQTGVWMAATKTHKYWGHYFRLPHLPLNSWGNSEINRLDGTGMLVGITSLVILLLFFISKIKNTYTENRKYYLFSLLYLGGICMSMLLFQGGDLHSLNRYIFATPFYFIFLLEFEKRNFTIRNVLLAFLLLIVYWLFFGSYLHIVTFLDYTLLAALLAVFLLTNNPNEKIAKWSFVVVYVGSTVWQAYFFVRFLNGVWIG